MIAKNQMPQDAAFWGALMKIGSKILPAVLRGGKVAAKVGGRAARFGGRAAMRGGRAGGRFAARHATKATAQRLAKKAAEQAAKMLLCRRLRKCQFMFDNI